MGKEIRIEVGSVRWRTEGWVALQATGANASVTTVPVAVAVGSSCNSSSSVGASINFRGSEASVELIGATGEPISGYSSEAAARVNVDDVAAPLVFGARRSLPAAVHGAGVAFRVRFSGELFGVSLRCVPK